MHSSEYFQIFLDTSFYRTLPVAASIYDTLQFEHGPKIEISPNFLLWKLYGKAQFP